MRDIKAIIDLLKIATITQTDLELSGELGIRPITISRWRK